MDVFEDVVDWGASTSMVSPCFDNTLVVAVAEMEGEQQGDGG